MKSNESNTVIKPIERYKISFIEIGCRTFDPEKDLWTNDHCQVQKSYARNFIHTIML